MARSTIAPSAHQRIISSDAGNYEEALSVADGISDFRLKNYADLMLVAKVYKKNGEYSQAFFCISQFYNGMRTIMRYHPAQFYEAHQNICLHLLFLLFPDSNQAAVEKAERGFL